MVDEQRNEIETIRIMNIVEDCTDNGAGLRTAVYVSGCFHACLGCHNVESWKLYAGTEMPISEVVDMIAANPLSDVTITGGGPLTVQYDNVLALLKAIKEQTDKNVWLYTGYTYEEVIDTKSEVLPYIDVLVDGKFILAEKDLTVPFRGSRNQRLIDVPNSLERGGVVLYDE